MTTTPRTYSRQVIAAWLHGYDTGHNVGHHDGRTAGFAEGYAVGHADGIPVGRDLADDEAAARFRAYRAMSDAIRPNLARPLPWGEAKPLPTRTECLATWPAPAAARALRTAA
ncbi:hypothetical protein ACFS27_09755 [Promicromonospora vindobonensis]|uniref:Uncharacterized protein n=1 Tax=Promicromonospora vindobonensis TaxID=195748 RepID=A0ABW5VUU9_9MICO